MATAFSIRVDSSDSWFSVWPPYFISKVPMRNTPPRSCRQRIVGLRWTPNVVRFSLRRRAAARDMFFRSALIRYDRRHWLSIQCISLIVRDSSAKSASSAVHFVCGLPAVVSCPTSHQPPKADSRSPQLIFQGVPKGRWIRKNSDERGVKVDRAEFLRIQLQATANDSTFDSLRFFAPLMLRVKK